MPKRTVTSSRVHRSALPFAQATVAGGFMFVACVGCDRDGRYAVGDMRAQTRQCLDNIRALIEEAGGTLADVVKCTVYVTDRAGWEPMNEAYFAYFRDDQPHRVSCIVAGLGDPECLVEIDATAYLGSNEDAMSDDERAIRDLIAAWLAASEAGDVQTVLSLMTDDVVFMIPGQEPFGKAAFAAAAQDLKNVRVQATGDIREIKVLGDWAYLRNFLKVTVTPPGGEPVRRAGHTLTILRKGADGKWLLARDANLLTKDNG